LLHPELDVEEYHNRNRRWRSIAPRDRPKRWRLCSRIAWAVPERLAAFILHKESIAPHPAAEPWLMRCYCPSSLRRLRVKILLIGTKYLAPNCLRSGAAVMSRKEAEFGDVVFVERRRDVRIIVSIPGRYSLSDRRDARGERRVFACRAVNVSPHAIALATRVNGNVGERVFAQIDHLGKLEGAVVRPLERGFVMNIVASEEERDRLAAKIEWLEMACTQFG
jgi:hypothetical protein